MTVGIVNTCPNDLHGASANLFLMLINSLMQSKCSLGSPEQYPPDYGPSITNNINFDFVIVGGGSAGSVLANKLTENGKWTVLVLEAGGYPSAISDIPSLFPELAGTKEDWQYESEPSTKAFSGFENKRCKYPRGKALGGSSSINYMMYCRGNKRDYDQWAEMGNIGWDWDNVFKHYQQMENFQGKYYGSGGFLGLSLYDSGEPLVDTLKKAGQELGYTLLSGENPFSPLGYVEIPLTVENGTRLNAAKAFLGKIKERTNLFVALNAFVTRINIDQTTKTAQGVEVQIGEKTFQIDARKEVILSAGAINSPQLLILSGIGPRPHLGDLGIPVVQDLPVGENLQDHLTVVGFNVRLNPNAVKNSSEGYILDEVYKYFRYRTGTFATLSSSNLVAFINTKIDSDFPNVEIVHFLSSLETNYAALNLLVKTGVASPSDLQHILDRAEGYPVLHFRPVLMKPKSRGKILLKSSNPYDHPSIDAGFYTDEDNEDLETLLEGVRYLEKMLETEAFAKHAPKLIRPKVCQESALGSDEFWRCLITHLTTHLFHQAGTCKMGPEGDRTAVVDPRLRVKGVKNLRVADASIMPVINSGHTNAPCMMIGHKAGVMIAEDWLRQEKHQEL